MLASSTFDKNLNSVGRYALMVLGLCDESTKDPPDHAMLSFDLPTLGDFVVVLLGAFMQVLCLVVTPATLLPPELFSELSEVRVLLPPSPERYDSTSSYMLPYISDKASIAASASMSNPSMSVLSSSLSSAPSIVKNI